MIVTLTQNNTIVLAGVPDDALVFNGEQWLPPHEAKVARFIVTHPIPGKPTNEVYGSVISVEAGYTVSALTTILNPIDNQYLACKTGTKLFNVEVIAK